MIPSAAPPKRSTAAERECSLTGTALEPSDIAGRVPAVREINGGRVGVVSIQMASTEARITVAPSGTFQIGDKAVHRLGFGAMRLTGPGIWGEPKDRQEAIRVLRRAVELGVDLIDNRDSDGRYVSGELTREALHPSPDDLLIATKAGLVRT